MPAVELIDTVSSLTAIIEEESAKLAGPGRHADLAELAEAKIRLVAALEAQTAQLGRERPDWPAQLDEEARAALARTLEDLRAASAINADVLGRQIALSTEMMVAVTGEARRLTGGGNATYGVHGGLLHTEQATPIALNARI